MKTKSRKIWSIPIAALAIVLMLAGALTVTGIVQAQTAPSTMTAVVGVVGDTIAYEVTNPPVEAEAPDDSGPTDIEVVLTTWTGVDAAGNVISSPPTTTATFNEAAPSATPPTPANISLDTGELTAGVTYTVKLIAVYDTDREVAAADNAATTDVLEDGRTNAIDDADTAIANDRDGQLRTTVTIHVPSVPASRAFQVEPSKVVDGEIISRVGNDRASDPLVFEIDNLGPGTATVAVVDPAGTDANVSYEVVDGNKIEVRSAVNNLTAAPTTYNAVITVNGGDFDLDDDDEIFTIEIDTIVNGANPLTFTNVELTGSAATEPLGEASDARITLGEDDGIHYSVTIPETTASGTGVLAYFVHGALAAVNDLSEANDDIDAEQITGTIGGDYAHLYSVNNDTMAITYTGPAGGLTAGDEHTLRLTASGDTGLANRLIVGMAKITVADVDSPPSKPADQAEIIYEDDDGAGFVKDDALVMNLTDLSTDPEGLGIDYVVVGTENFDVDDDDNLRVNAATGIGNIFELGEDDPDTADVDETDWPTGTTDSEWSLVTPVTSKYPRPDSNDYGQGK